jgi:hypothetical protein
VLAGDRRRLLVELERGGRGGRVVGVVEPQDPGALPRGGVDRAEIGEEAALRRQGQLEDLLAGEGRAALGDGVGGGGDRHELAADDLREVEDRLLGAEGGEDLGAGIQRGAEAALHPARHGGAQDAEAVGQRVGRLRRERGRERLADERRRVLARLPDPEVDHGHAAREEVPLRVREPHEGIAAQPGEHRRRLHARPAPLDGEAAGASAAAAKRSSTR